MTDFCSPLIISPPDTFSLKTIDSLTPKLDSNDDNRKAEILTQIISIASVSKSGVAALSQAVIPVIKFCFSSKNKSLKRLCLAFWELFWLNKGAENFSDATLLVCNRLMQDLDHDNEFLCGATLRLLCSFREPEVVRNANQAIRNCLQHPSDSVKANAVMALAELFPENAEAFPGVCDDVLKIGLEETDEITRRNCFLMLKRNRPDLALKFLASFAKNICKEKQLIQIEIIDFIKNAKADKKTDIFYRKILIELLSSLYHPVKLGASEVLLTSLGLNVTPAEIENSIFTLVEIFGVSTDSNAKIYLLRRLFSFQNVYAKEFAKHTADLILNFSKSHYEVQTEILFLLSHMICVDNKEEIISFLRFELKSQKNDKKLQKALLKTVFDCTETLSDSVKDFVPVLFELIDTAEAIPDENLFSRILCRALEYNDFELDLKLISGFQSKLPKIKNAGLMKTALWIITQVSQKCNVETILSAFDSIILYFYDPRNQTDPLLNKDILRLDDNFLVSYLASALAKMALCLKKKQYQLKKYGKKDLLDFCEAVGGDGNGEDNFDGVAVVINVKVALSIATLLSVLKHLPNLDQNSANWVTKCIQSILSPERFGKLFSAQSEADGIPAPENRPPPKKGFSAERAAEIGEPFSDVFGERKSRAAPSSERASEGVGGGRRKMRVSARLTGYQDPVMVEATVAIDGYYAIIDFYVFNRTGSEVKNFSIELYTTNRLKPEPMNGTDSLAPGSVTKFTTKVVVNSSEGGTIIGYARFGKNSAARATLAFSPVKLSSIDFLNPAKSTASDFAEMWNEFEWENTTKLSLPMAAGALADFGEIAAKLNLCCLGEPSGLASESDFFCVNMCGETVFGDKCLVNMCLEKKDNKLIGDIKVRSNVKELVKALISCVNDLE